MPKTSATALIIDDEPDILQLLSITLGRMKLATVTAASVKEARARLQEQTFDLCLTDMRLPDGSGMDIIDTVQQDCPETPIAVLTAHGNMELAIEALKRGAFDFVSKPVNLGKLRELVQSALKLSEPQPPDTVTPTARLLGVAPSMIKLRETITKVARSQAPVAIYGESGTGKELVAQLIHRSSPRREASFVPVNCGAIPAELMESELFGHIKGSFTGAVADKPGLFQLAEGGTLFLDEVAELPLRMQVKLLRVIQEKAMRPVGSGIEQPCNVRILSATHKNLANLVANSSFRQDLYYRLNVIEILVPPLRERRQDISDLARAILARQNQNIGISKHALTKLAGYNFPGNVRELENILERAITLMEQDTISEDDLIFSSVPISTVRHDAKPDDTAQQSERAGRPLDEYIESIEKFEITRALETEKWNRTAAAKRLGMSFRALRYKLQKLGLDQ